MLFILPDKLFNQGDFVVSTFRRFEEIKAWQKAREITQTIYRLSNKDNFAKDFSLRDQMKRASISIMANIAEGHGR
jgi:hypothetical protein